MTTIESTIQIPQDVLFHDLSGEAVLLNLATGKYFGLDEVGSRMWELLSQHGSIQPAFLTLLEEFEVDEEQLRTDLITLVDELASHGLLTIIPPPMGEKSRI